MVRAARRPAGSAVVEGPGGTTAVPHARTTRNPRTSTNLTHDQRPEHRRRRRGNGPAPSRRDPDGRPPRSHGRPLRRPADRPGWRPRSSETHPPGSSGARRARAPASASALPRQLDATLPQIVPAAFVVRHHASDGLPVVASVTTMPQVHELMDDDIVDQAHRGLDDAPVQADGSGSGCSAPGRR